MNLEVQNILKNKGFEEAKKVFSELELDWNIQTSPVTGKKYLHIDYGIKSPKANNIVKECRGIAFSMDTWEVARFGFYRFMNMGETGQDKFDQKSPISYEEKADGSIIMLWWSEEEGWVVGTRGRIFSDAKLPEREMTFGQLFWDNFNGISMLNKDMMYVFEICSTYNRVVVFYQNPQIVLLSARRKGNLVELKDWDLDLVAADLGVRRPNLYTFKTIDEAMEKAKILPGTEEGYVAKQWSDKEGRYLRAKIKGHSYKDLHMIFSAKSLNNLVRLSLRNDISYFEFFPEFIPAFNALRKFFFNHAEEAEKVWEENKWILDDMSTPFKDKKKKFAQAVMQTKFGNYCFNRADGKTGSMWDEYARALEVKSRTRKYIKEFNLDKLVDNSWNLEVQEEE